MRCSEISRDLAEPLAGTALQARGYVCVEHPGPWAAKAVAGSGSNELVALEQRAAAHGLRVLLVRESGAPARGGALLASFAGGWTERIDAFEPGRLDDERLAALAAGNPTGLGAVARAPLYLVCTNGRRDACCALHGAKVARSLAERFSGQIFESSHLGGHRFAANVLALPSGMFFGRLGPDSALATATELEAGRLDGSTHLRGRASHSPAEQVVDAHLRTELGRHAVDAVAVEQLSSEGDRFRVAGRVSGQTDVLTTVRKVSAEPRPISCGEAPEAVERYVIDTVEPLS